MNFENYIVHIRTQKKEEDLNHPLNDFSSSKSSGTGFYIDCGIILTCYHVVQNSLKIFVKTYNLNNEKQFGLNPTLPNNPPLNNPSNNEFTPHNTPKVNLNVCCNVINLERRPDRLEKFKTVNYCNCGNIALSKIICFLDSFRN
jgi:hypothetical protein